MVRLNAFHVMSIAIFDGKLSDFTEAWLYKV